MEGGDAGQHTDRVDDVTVVGRDVFRQMCEDRADPSGVRTDEVRYLDDATHRFTKPA